MFTSIITNITIITATITINMIEPTLEFEEQKTTVSKWEMNKAQWFLTPALKFIIVIWTLRGQRHNLIWFFPLKEQEWPSAREGKKKAFEEKATEGERHLLFEVKRITSPERSWLVIIIFISIIIIVILIAIIVFIIVFIKIHSDISRPFWRWRRGWGQTW